MQSRLDLVIENFKEYMRSIRVSTLNDEIEVEYTLLAYDYIDDDLDFNEDYYQGLCVSFQKWLKATALDMVREREARKVTLVRNIMIFRNTDAHAETFTFSIAGDNSYISVQKETRENMKSI